MPGPGAPQPPDPPHAATGIPSSCEPLGPLTGGGTACQEATTDFTAEAIIFAIEFLITGY